MRIPQALTALLAIASLTFAGCADTSAPPADGEPVDSAPKVLPQVLDLKDIAKGIPMNFTENVVDAAVGFAADLYEPTMEVSDTGVIYVTGHTILVDTTGAPVFFSKDDGKSWDQLPFAGPATMPEPVHGATPPPSDEIFLVAGDDGQLWGVDITLLTFPVNGWCGDGAEHCYHNPDAYDVAQAQTTRADAVQAAATDEESACSALNLNDRPWAAYGNGKLLMVNNPGGGPVQVGAMDVPPALPVGGPQMGVAGGTWNLCAGQGGGSIPGIPDMRDDHFFAVPQVQGDKLVIVKGNAADVMDVEQVTVFNNTNAGGGTSNYGQAVFDQEGTMFIGIRNNTWKEEQRDGVFGPTTARVAVDGQLHLAVSQDNGTTFVERTLRLDAVATSIYMDGNMAGPGALLTWAQRDEGNGTDWYAAHVFVGPDGGPVVENVNLVVDNGPSPSAHVQGAASGPDGRAYLVMFHGGYGPADQATPLHVWIQQDGPTLPVHVPVVAAQPMP